MPCARGNVFSVSIHISFCLVKKKYVWRKVNMVAHNIAKRPPKEGKKKTFFTP
jgi:hypothetical protein